MADKKHAQYLEKDGETKLFHGDDVEQGLKDGWKIAEGNKSNGEPWNPEVRDDEVSILDAQAEVIRSNQVRQDKVDEQDAKQEKKAEAEADKSAKRRPE